MSGSDFVGTTGWFKSSRSSETQSCVEVKFDGDLVLIRDSKQNSTYVDTPDEQPRIAFPTVQWLAFLDLVLSAQPGRVETLTVDLHQDGRADVTGHSRNGSVVKHHYTTKEWDAFMKAVADSEFERP